MPGFRKTFRLFVSSTFADMKLERDALQNDVFPRLRDLAMRHGCRFQAIDLRWGVSSEAALDHQAMKICLTELQRCQDCTPRPNFLLLLGQRYGWQPLPAEIPAVEFDQITRILPAEDLNLLCWSDQQPDGENGWYRRDDNAIPPVYVLRPRRVNVPPDATQEERNLINDEEAASWQLIESLLRSMLARALDELGWRNDDPRRRKYEESATHQEVRAGALASQNPRDHVFCFFRNINGLPQGPAAKDYLDLTTDLQPDDAARSRLDRLKDDLKLLVPQNVHPVEAGWTGSEMTQRHLKRFCDDVFKVLEPTILEEIKKLEQVAPEALEDHAHIEFGMGRTDSFVGRRSYLDTISRYLNSASPFPLAVMGAGGSGKTALMARAAIIESSRTAPGTVVTRFIGTTPGSCDGHLLLADLCRHISAERGLNNPVATEYDDLVEEFESLLSTASEQNPIVLFIDGLDQLSDLQSARLLNWLPDRLPAGSKVVISSSLAADDCCTAISRRIPQDQIIRLEPLHFEEGEQLFDRLLANAGRRISPAQHCLARTALHENSLPLFVRMAAAEAACWRSFSPATDTELAPDIAGSFHRLFDALASESRHGATLVKAALGLLASSRFGLAEDEMLDLLSLDPAVMDDFYRRSPKSPRVNTLPVVVWSRLRMDLAPYLTERMADAASLINFYHDQAARSAVDFALETEIVHVRHRQLAEYFTAQECHPDGTPDVLNLRKLSEQAWQQHRAGTMLSELTDTLTDVTGFLHAKCLAGRAIDLLHDYDACPADSLITGIMDVRRAIGAGLSDLIERPQASLQTLFNHLRWSESIPPLLRQRLGLARALLDIEPAWLLAETPPLNLHSGFIELPLASEMQALSTVTNSFAIGTIDGRVEVRDLEYGNIVNRRHLSGKRCVALTVCANADDIAWQDSEGLIIAERSGAVLQGRAGDTALTYHPSCGILAIREDNVLVAWSPDTGRAMELVRDVPAPACVLKVDRDGRHALVVGGRRTQRATLASFAESVWQDSNIPCSGMTVVDADLDSESGVVLLASTRHMLHIVPFGSATPSHELAWEQAGAGIQGMPEKCALGRGPTAGTAFVATHLGMTGAWDWRTGELRRMGDFRTPTEHGGLAIFDTTLPHGRLFMSTAHQACTSHEKGSSIHNRPHSGAVAACDITHSGRIVTASKDDHTVRWFDVEADGLRQCAIQPCHSPTAISTRVGTEDCVIGSADGLLWNQAPGRTTPSDEIFMALSEPVVSVASIDDRSALAAGKSGLVLRVHLFEDRVDVLRQAPFARNLRKVMSAGNSGSHWTLGSGIDAGSGTNIPFMLFDDNAGRERRVVGPGNGMVDAATNPEGSLICLVGRSVEVYGRLRDDWVVKFKRAIESRLVCFVGDSMLGVISNDRKWLNILSLSDSLPTLAGIFLHQQASCLAARGGRVTVGFQSGDVMSLRLSGLRVPPT